MIIITGDVVCRPDSFDEALRLSEEHAEYRWVAYEEGLRNLRWDSNKTALWELHHRLTTSQVAT